METTFSLSDLERFTTHTNHHGKSITTNFFSYEEACKYAAEFGGKVGEAYYSGGDDFEVASISEPLEVRPEDFEGCGFAFGEDLDGDFDALKDRIKECSSIDEINKLVDSYNFILNKYENLEDDQFITYDSCTFKYYDTYNRHPTSYEDMDGHRHELCVFESL